MDKNQKTPHWLFTFILILFFSFGLSYLGYLLYSPAEGGQHYSGRNQRMREIDYFFIREIMAGNPKIILCCLALFTVVLIYFLKGGKIDKVIEEKIAANGTLSVYHRNKLARSAFLSALAFNSLRGKMIIVIIIGLALFGWVLWDLQVSLQEL